uniref:Allergen protein n=1 Tax=Liposcelis bostrychophila TaxID=185214 RepID=A0A1L7LR29_LIPBO|nr:allergen protein [Liposcelis bostrychophila]
MAAIKFILIAFLAFSVSQTTEANVVAQPKAFDIIAIVKQVIDIVRIVVKAVNDAVPDIDKILQQLVALLPSDVAATVTTVLDAIKQAITDENARIDHIIQVLEKAMDDLLAIDPCYQPQADAIKAVLDKALSGIDGVLHGSIDAHKADIDNVIAGFSQDLEDLRNLYDTQLPAAVVCLTPGNAESCGCLDGVKETVVNGVVSLAANFVLHLTAASDVLKVVVPEVINGSTPIVNDGLAAAGPLIDNVCTCVAAM